MEYSICGMLSSKLRDQVCGQPYHMRVCLHVCQCTPCVQVCSLQLELESVCCRVGHLQEQPVRFTCEPSFYNVFRLSGPPVDAVLLWELHTDLYPIA